MGENGFQNVYDDDDRASAYATLEFPGTYLLAFRDLPALAARHVSGKRALDFGCGTGRSTRFLAGLGYDAMGVDISEPMLEKARQFDPHGRYEAVGEGDLGNLAGESFDLILSTFTFDNIPTVELKARTFQALAELLNARGRIISVVSSPEIYLNEWASFSTKNYPENREARSGDTVLIEMLDVEDGRPVKDVLFDDASYRGLYDESQLDVIEVIKPLATGEEGTGWVSETEIPPWVIYVLGAAENSP